MQGAQILRSEAYLGIRCNDEGCSATPQMDFLRSHQSLSTRGRAWSLIRNKSNSLHYLDELRFWKNRNRGGDKL